MLVESRNSSRLFRNELYRNVTRVRIWVRNARAMKMRLHIICYKKKVEKASYSPSLSLCLSISVKYLSARKFNFFRLVISRCSCIDQNRVRQISERWLSFSRVNRYRKRLFVAGETENPYQQAGELDLFHIRGICIHTRRIICQTLSLSLSLSHSSF